MFDTLIVQPILNLLAVIYALVPGNDFGIAVIIFTIIIRMMLWPLLKKQLHQTRKIKELQPEVKKIKEKTKGDKQKEGQLLMELYKERGVSPFGSIGLLFVQLPILIGLFQGLRRISDDANSFVDISYPWVQNLGHMKDITEDIANFDSSLLGFVDLTRAAFADGAETYVPVLILALLAAVFQFYQTKGMQPDDDKKKSIRDILKGEAKGEKSEQADINAAMSRNMRYLFPVLTFFFASRVPGALALYWTAGSLVGIIQQRTVLNRDVEEMEESVPDEKPKSPKTKKLKKEPTGKSSNSRKSRKKRKK